jgi:hypothetical protein
MPTKKKITQLEELSQTHGKEESETFAPTSLEQILGITGQTKYGTMDEGEYQNKLDNLSKSDLQAHATKIGIVPVDNRDRLIKTMMQQFRLHLSSFRHPKRPVGNANAKQVSPEIAKILALGR